MAGDTGAPGFLPLYDDNTSFAPIQDPFNGISQALNAALKKNAFTTFADLATLNLPANVGTIVGQHATVNADSTTANNGDYSWTGTKWARPAIGLAGGRLIRSGVAGAFGSGWTLLQNALWAVDQPLLGCTVTNGVFSGMQPGVYEVEAAIMLDSSIAATLILKKNSLATDSTGIQGGNTCGAGPSNFTLVSFKTRVRITATTDTLALAILFGATAQWSNDKLTASSFAVRYVEPLR